MKLRINQEARKEYTINQKIMNKGKLKKRKVRKRKNK